MGRVPEPAAEDRFRLDGESKMPGGDGTDNEDGRVPVSFRDSARKRCSCQRNDFIYDITAESQPFHRLLQQAVR